MSTLTSVLSHLSPIVHTEVAGRQAAGMALDNKAIKCLNSDEVCIPVNEHIYIYIFLIFLLYSIAFLVSISFLMGSLLN